MDKVKALVKAFIKYMEEDFGPDEPIVDVPAAFRKADNWVQENVSPSNWLSEEEKLEVEKEFSKWWNTNIATKKSEEWVVEGVKEDSEIDTTSRSISSGRDPDLTSKSIAREPYERLYGDLPEDGQYGIENFEEFFGKFGYNVDPDLINDEILRLQAEGTEEAKLKIIELTEYQALMETDALVRPAFNDDGTPMLDANGKQYFLPFQSHFDGVKISDIIDSNATPEEITAWQNYLVRHNIVPDEYFAGSEGQMSEQLRASIKYVMNWLDQNRHVVKGTDVYANEIEGQDAIFFTSHSSMYEDADYHRNLINYALKEMAAERVQLDKADEAKIAEQLAKDFIPPRKENLEEMVEAYFEQKLNRKPTAQELDQWSGTFAESYNVAYAQARAQAQQLADYNFMQSNTQYFENEAEQKQFEKDYPGIGFTDLSQFSIDTEEDIFQDQLDAEFGKTQDAVERGRAIRKMQSDLIQYMFGG